MKLFEYFFMWPNRKGLEHRPLSKVALGIINSIFLDFINALLAFKRTLT